jgi:hypothetical protein
MTPAGKRDNAMMTKTIVGAQIHTYVFEAKLPDRDPRVVFLHVLKVRYSNPVKGFMV